MASKKKKLRCWVCGVPATHRMSSTDHVCDNTVCEQITREHMELSVTWDAAKEEQQARYAKYQEGAQA